MNVSSKYIGYVMFIPVSVVCNNVHTYGNHCVFIGMFHFLQTLRMSITFLITEFYEEALSLVFDLTSKSISPDMWTVLELIYQVSDCLTD
jgi:hypothetical protein